MLEKIFLKISLNIVRFWLLDLIFFTFLNKISHISLNCEGSRYLVFVKIKRLLGFLKSHDF